jgi:hypothetical protein
MRKNNSSLEELIKEAIQEEYENAPTPVKSKADTWLDINKKLKDIEEPSKNSPWIKKMTVVAASVLILTTVVFSQSQNSSAFGWLSTLFFNVNEENRANISGSIGTPPMDGKGAPPPSPEVYQVNKVETKEEIMSLSEAQDVTDFEILVPKKVPEYFGPPSVKVFFANDEVDNKIELQYSHDQDIFTINEHYVRGQMGYGYSVDFDDTKVQEVMIHGKKGVLFSFKNGDKRLIWDYLNYQLELNGRLSEEQIIEIARSIVER